MRFSPSSFSERTRAAAKYSHDIQLGSDISQMLGEEQPCRAWALCPIMQNLLGVKVLKHFVRCAAAALALVSLSGGAFAECMIFEKENFQGGQGIIAPNDLVKFFEEEVQFSGVPEGTRVFTDVSWRDNIGSVKLTNGCQMITYDKPEASTKHRRYITDSASMIANMNTEVATLAAAAHCSCK